MHSRASVAVRVLLGAALGATLCVVPQRDGAAFAGDVSVSANASTDASSAHLADTAVDFEHDLDDYTPKRNSYNFYFTYKLVHPWWDAVALGMEDARASTSKRALPLHMSTLRLQASLRKIKSSGCSRLPRDHTTS